jgi:AcrR family transcriptional regulator
MPRSGAAARQRLQQAAVELFLEHGYEHTTAAEIATRAGVTERTFFRHFPDKREVLFDGQTVLEGALTSAVARAPAMLKPLEVLRWVFCSVEKILEDNRSFSVPRRQVIDHSPALQERELAKEGALAESLALSLRERGVDERLATLAAQTGMATFQYAVASWFADSSSGLNSHLDRAFYELYGLASPLFTEFEEKAARNL